MLLKVVVLPNTITLPKDFGSLLGVCRGWVAGAFHAIISLGGAGRGLVDNHRQDSASLWGESLDQWGLAPGVSS